MKYTVIGILIILIFLYRSNSKEKFENETRICSDIYGFNHPRCQNELEHIGYFKIKDIKYPIINLIHNLKKERYLLKNGKFYKFKKEYWNDSFYFRNPIYYSEEIPYSILNNFTFRGFIENNSTSKKYYIFGRKIFSSNYEYLIFCEKNGKLEHKFNITYRRKLEHGDVVYVKKDSSTFGPFIFQKEL